MNRRAIEQVRHVGPWAVVLALLLVTAVPAAPTAVALDLNPTRDNSLYESQPTFSNGAGISLYAGETNVFGSRRALLGFDVAGSVASGSTVTAATLTLNVISGGPFSTAADVYTLHRVNAAWGESTSNAGAIGGVGAPAAIGDATWTHRLWNTDLWTTAGGDFAGAPSASAATPISGPVVFILDALEVQDMLDNPGGDFGWILLGDETLPGSARRLQSRQGALPPVLHLEITAAPVCGDGTVDAGEECDDGNTNPGDGCDALCQFEPFCGDGTVDAGEECDDGNTNPGDGCDALCQFEPFCGDGTVDAGEECDDGNTNPGDGCDALCQFEPFCGDGTVDAGEECDDGNTNPGDGCDALCQFEVFCGNSNVDAGEECDEGGSNSESPGATCRTDCTLAGCGDGVVDPGETCDAGGGNSDDPGASCRTDCSFGGCGDGILDPGEVCDDGNTAENDACPGNCGVETIPTLSEWGQIVMLLLLLVAGTLGVRQRVARTGSTGTGTLALAGGLPRFDPVSYARVLALVLAFVACGLGATLAVAGALAGIDVVGALISAPILAYLVHLWRMREGQ